MLSASLLTALTRTVFVTLPHSLYQLSFGPKHYKIGKYAFIFLNNILPPRKTEIVFQNALIFLHTVCIGIICVINISVFITDLIT